MTLCKFRSRFLKLWNFFQILAVWSVLTSLSFRPGSLLIYLSKFLIDRNDNTIKPFLTKYSSALNSSHLFIISMNLHLFTWIDNLQVPLSTFYSASKFPKIYFLHHRMTQDHDVLIEIMLTQMWSLVVEKEHLLRSSACVIFHKKGSWLELPVRNA